MLPFLHVLKSAQLGLLLGLLQGLVVGSQLCYLRESAFPLFSKSGYCLSVCNILAFSVFSWIPQRWSERFLEPIFEFPSGPGVLTAVFPIFLAILVFLLSEPRLFSYSWWGHSPWWRYGNKFRSWRIQLYLWCGHLPKQRYLLLLLFFLSSPLLYFNS